ncbi:hypothetical protein [Micromonospora mirobrigensis]|uniref:Uncharacterized protein n=1 Tax=Micromonospora mirobrigensis TaxID=262898 RepID=A0A1C4YP53_9ACTN|nr:hypothetical protein [Micromonospora mirobrigensis]SCF22543.1 hypothetical protein GA0070564_104257 [Micromonospora mirobrigensis]
MPAGQRLDAGRIPGERIATTYLDTDSATFTAETVIATVSAPLVTGRTYRVRLITRIGTSVAGDVATPRLREDSLTGAERTVDYLPLPNSGTVGNLFQVEFEYTATATATKTFVATCLRSGTGNAYREASSNRPTYFYVEYLGG